MERFFIQGGTPLVGEIRISGGKNSVLPLMITSLLTNEDIILDNVPYLSDVVTLCELLESLGVDVEIKSSDQHKHKIENIHATTEDVFQVKLNAKGVNNFLAHYDIVQKMRASFWVLGPLLAHYRKAEVSLPGGCKIGARQIGLHLETLQAMGASIYLENGYVTATSQGRLQGTRFTFSKVSVGATINAIMTASLAQGESIFVNCACEPEITDLCNLLVKMGAHIEGIGTSVVKILGQDHLKGAKHFVMPDRIETGTYMAAVGIAGGDLKLHGIHHGITKNLCEKFAASGVNIFFPSEDTMQVRSSGKIYAVDVETNPYPGLPTDMQAQFMALMCLSDGVSKITENIFENRFMHVPELMRMGADIFIQNNMAIVKGIPRFKGAHVAASDLRASVCLVLAAISAEGNTIIDHIHHIDRGYSRIEKKLNQCGASIVRAAND